MTTTTEKVTGFPKATKKKASEKDSILGPKICGVHVELTKRATMMEVLKFDDDAASSLSNADLVRLVARNVVLKTWPKDINDITQCFDCRAISFFDIPNIPEGCPYCGSEKTVRDAAPTQKEVDDARLACEAEAHEEPSPPAAVAEQAPAEEKAMTNTTTSVPAGTKKNGASATPSMLAGGGTAMVKAAPAPMVQHTELELDAAIRKYEDLKSGAFVSEWDKWNHVRVNLYENGLWKQRRDDAGAPGRYKTWQSFCNAELNCAPGTAVAQMAVCAVVSREEFKQWGSTKANLLIQAPKEEQARIQKMIEGRASTREISAVVRAAKDNETIEQKEARIKGTPAEKKAKAAGAKKFAATLKAQASEKKAKSDALKEAAKPGLAKITVAAIEGKHSLDMFTTDSVRAEAKGKGERVRAKKLDQMPVCEMELQKGVWVKISWRSLPGGLKTDVEFFRK